jgi:signal transduction histidine kinase
MPSEDAPSGYGIGLAIVKGILDAHNADIKVESSYGERTRFRIFFDKSMVIKEEANS